MPGTMSEADLVADLKASLFDAANVFVTPADADFKRFLQQALPEMQVKRPVTKLASVALIAGQASYAIAADDFAAFKNDLWRDATKMPKPWSTCWPGPLPRLSADWSGSAWSLVFDPAPTFRQVDVFGAECKFYYFAKHTIGVAAVDTTVNAQDRGLLLLRSQAEAMLALGMRNAAKPVQMRDGLSGTPRNSTPAALHEILMRAFREWR